MIPFRYQWPAVRRFVCVALTTGCTIAPMPDTIQIIATIDGVPYAKTVQVEKVTVMGAYWTMHDLLEDVRMFGDETE